MPTLQVQGRQSDSAVEVSGLASLFAGVIPGVGLPAAVGLAILGTIVGSIGGAAVGVALADDDHRPK